MIQMTIELGPAAAATATHCRLLHAVTKYKTTSPSPSGRVRWTSSVLPLIRRSHCACKPYHSSSIGVRPSGAPRERDHHRDDHGPNRYLFSENRYENRNPSVRGRLTVFALTHSV